MTEEDEEVVRREEEEEQEESREQREVSEEGEEDLSKRVSGLSKLAKMGAFVEEVDEDIQEERIRRGTGGVVRVCAAWAVEKKRKKTAVVRLFNGNSG